MAGGRPPRIPGESYDEPKKVVFEAIPAEATEAQFLDALKFYGAVKVTHFKREFERPDVKRLMVETATEDHAAHLLRYGAGFIGEWHRCRPCRSKVPPIRCNRCQEFLHAGTKCTKDLVCSECSGNHLYDDPTCPARGKKVPGVASSKCCPNCKKAGREDLDHSAGWGGCPESKKQRNQLYSEVTKKNLAEAEQRKAERREEVRAAEGIKAFQAKIEAAVCARVSDIIFKLLDGLVSGMAGASANSANPKEQQAHMVNQLELAIGGEADVDFDAVRKKFKLKKPQQQ
jgi:hypothetical protein